MYQYGDLHTTLITEILLIFLLTKKKKKTFLKTLSSYPPIEA